ncbi:MAG: NADH-quinone oxidoreductase subunit J [Proteobacteria bacterium]|nr:NADH-quinone oxidoreductase subunit J [Pseudomonadota bacterium]HQR04609.1 NADH-quinone oxidoreductase subunit J [Rhodocyclaceae bacterium]
MDFKTFLFYLFATILVVSGLRVITARNPVHAVLFLVLAFFNAAGIWLLLAAEYLAITLLVVYVGAVMVLFLFVVMMLDINLESIRRGFWHHLPFGTAIGLLMVAEMATVLGGRYFDADILPAPAIAPGYSNVKELGRVLYTEYAYPFELASVILLVAIIAAVTLTLRKRKDTKALNSSVQLAVKRNDRIRIVRMAAEKEQGE